jgi:hypothetical protein
MMLMNVEVAFNALSVGVASGSLYRWSTPEKL